MRTRTSELSRTLGLLLVGACALLLACGSDDTPPTGSPDSCDPGPFVCGYRRGADGCCTGAPVASVCRDGGWYCPPDLVTPPDCTCGPE